MQPIVNVLGASGLALLAGLWLVPLLTLHAAEAAKPNIMIILADDMGFSDASCYGGEIATPNLDALARDGLRFTQFYNTTRCWPSRASTWCGSARSASGPLGPQTRRQQADVRAAAGRFRSHASAEGGGRRLRGLAPRTEDWGTISLLFFQNFFVVEVSRIVNVLVETWKVLDRKKMIAENPLCPATQQTS